MYKCYQLKKSNYYLSIVVPTGLALLAAGYMVFQFINNAGSALAASVIIITLLLFTDHFVALTHPECITVTEDSIAFASFRRQHVYPFHGIERLNMRQMGLSKDIYLRINDAGFFKGRYWIRIQDFSDGEELKSLLEQKMMERHPRMTNFNRHSFSRTK